ncbi:MAG: MSMEG_0568 family radical SAM protein [Desulfovibrio sp.]|jgi:radical SAM protein (TIGR04043 family)/putative N-acetyltransferase (TIGR04045 family)|nr:MSMEG_0568 family radical SAM protein [Desulfovibrio sp.]
MEMTFLDYVSLHSGGARVADSQGIRRGGAGPADAGAYLIQGRPLMVPALSPSARHSEYALVRENQRSRLERNGRFLCYLDPVPAAGFYQKKTADGIPYPQIARLHGKDCLASTVIQECVRYSHPRTRCRFCAIGASLERGATILRKTPAQLAEVALAARELDGVTHVTLTAGTTAPPDAGALYLARCAAAVREAAGLPVEIQFEPVRDSSSYALFRELGVTDVGLHVESFDPAVRRRVTPGKAEIGLEEYFEAFALAVDVFGRNKVSTYVILGLGENERLTLEGCARAAALGVYPIVVPLRPLVDSCFARAKPVDPKYLERMYRALGRILQENGLAAEYSSAGCARCKACSLLQFTEQEQTAAQLGKDINADKKDINIRIAEDERDKDSYMQIRHRVFVEEQKIFPICDKDDHDDAAVYILARVRGVAAGGVRCYPRGGGVWFGGRLAVLPEFRQGFNLGVLLVREAVDVMRRTPGVRRFRAAVQDRNVRFFSRLGWEKRGRPFLWHGWKHQIMEYPLCKKTGQ